LEVMQGLQIFVLSTSPTQRHKAKATPPLVSTLSKKKGVDFL
jgi:hypothetical protein